VVIDNEVIVLDNSYTFEHFQSRGNIQALLARSSGEFFSHVWNVHTFSDIDGYRAKDPIEYIEISRNASFVKGFYRISGFDFFPLLGFIVAQLKLFIYLRQLIRERNIMVVRVGDPLYLGVFGFFLTRFTKAKFMIRVNGNNNKIRNEQGSPLYPRLLRKIWLEEAIERFIFPRADLVAAPNVDNQAYAISMGSPPLKTVIFRYGNLLDKKHFLERSARNPNHSLLENLGLEHKGYLLCVSRLISLKYVEDCIRAFALKADKFPYIKLLLVGDGDEADNYKNLAKALNVGDSVIFAGNLPQSDIADLYFHATMLLSPLCGRVLSEAALSQLPIIAYNVDWHSEIIHDEETGILVPFRDVEIMAEKIEFLLRNPKIADDLAVRLRHLSMKMLSPETINAFEKESFQKLLQPLDG
jgi:glycosyltransferase involved in cell wall biosynthesis